MKKTLTMILAGLLSLAGFNLWAQEIPGFNHDWQFRITQSPLPPDVHTSPAPGSGEWVTVDLPHTAVIEPVNSTLKQWQGRCEYRKSFSLPESAKLKKIWLRFHAAMNAAVIKLNGKEVGEHTGGYLPFTVDITNAALFDRQNTLEITLTNLDNEMIPPGKRLADLDFNWYSGLYRGVSLFFTDYIHITDAVDENHEAGGGILLWYDKVSEKSAQVNLKVEVQNAHAEPADVHLIATILSEDGRECSKTGLIPLLLESFSTASLASSMLLTQPRLWSVADPYLYTLKVDVFYQDKVVDSQTLTMGIRSISFSARQGFLLNGKELKIRGTNRHQEYPYLGYALSDNAQYRDAAKIKAAGFNFVRCSHYPPSTAFLDACDRLGLLVMDAIPGWQFFEGKEFQDHCVQDVRDMIHRDRNHPCVILWEASLNESDMSTDFMQRAHDAVHRELPFPDVYTCGWKDEVYDVFIPARQHAKPPKYWNSYNKKKPILIAEYGDWEYYAQNAGFNQKEYANLKEEERTSRQLRGSGETRLLQQALNFQEAHNDNLEGSAVGDANWLMFDYKRGYAPDIESSGIMDIFRLPKYAYYFYRSQEIYPSPDPRVKPMIYIAPDWDKQTARIFSNCEQVKLFANDQEVSSKEFKKEVTSDNLDRPPYVFQWQGREIGRLKAKGFSDDKSSLTAVEYSCSKPGQARGLKLEADLSGKELEAGKNDVIFIYAFVTDADGMVVKNEELVKFSVEGNAELIGENPVKTEAGIAAILLRAGNSAGSIRVTAEAEGLPGVSMEISAK